ncbi:MAG: alanine racemase [Leptospiraceae bacterium]|nr:alanine racemase [Leptospiraceae bacterium]MCP5511150.1 alanine racemase [Leptospiraceae bacterium]
MAKKIYTRPVIQRQFMGAANKFGGFVVPESMNSIDGIEINELIAEFGSPLFVFSESTIRRKMKELKQAFGTRYPHYQPAWSYKTNYLNAICKVFHDEGSWAEVVSGYEYKKARKNGIPGNKIIFNGPYKKYEDLKLAASEGARIHVDHLDEVSDLIKISEELGKEIEIAIRINMDSGMYPVWSRFGFNLETGHAIEAVRKISFSKGKLKLIGVHSHIGTFILDTGIYKKGVKKICEFYKKIRDEFHLPLSYIDVGGGFASPSKLKAQYMADSSTIPSLDAYAEAITSTIYDVFGSEEPPLLFTESGRALIDEAGYLVTSIVASKTMPSGKRGLVLDAGVNLLYTSTWYDYKVYPVGQYSGTYEQVVLYGPLCMNIDVVRENVLLPSMQRGDKMVLYPIGAYNVTQWMQFIEMRPAIVMIDKNKKPVIIRRAETVDDVNSIENS